ncbi:MAG: hypothetical protein AAF664_12590, partial [Planctomycetota bacterium]
MRSSHVWSRERSPLKFMVAGFLAIMAWNITNVDAQQPFAATMPPGHAILNGSMPPGAVGNARLSGHGPGPVFGYYQPIKFVGPVGTKYAIASMGAFADAEKDLMVGLLVGSVYRFKVTDIERRPGVELYPSVEIIDRTYPPAGLETRYPIEIHLDEEDFDAALEGRMVTRVVYLEDPQNAVPLDQSTNPAKPIELSTYQNALTEADRYGRPVAIVRLGSLTPPRNASLWTSFAYGNPPYAPIFQSRTGLETSLQSP